MPTFTLRDCHDYLYHCDRAKRATEPGADSGVIHEARVSRDIADRLRREHPELHEAAHRARKAIESPAQTPPKPSGAGKPGWWAGLGVVASTVADRAAVRMAEEASALSTGSYRFETLGPGVVDVRQHRCADGQVCLEIRTRLRDVADPRRFRSLIRGVEQRLADALDADE